MLIAVGAAALALGRTWAGPLFVFAFFFLAVAVLRRWRWGTWGERSDDSA
jgi:hypothetical protein